MVFELQYLEQSGSLLTIQPGNSAFSVLDDFSQGLRLALQLISALSLSTELLQEVSSDPLLLPPAFLDLLEQLSNVRRVGIHLVLNEEQLVR